MNNTRITAIGRIGTTPDARTTPWGDLEVTFRLACTDRRVDKDGKWVDGQTSWYTVRTRRHVAEHVRNSLEKGLQVIVVGKLRVRPWETENGSGVSVDIDAEHVGPDLTFANAVVQPVQRAAAPAAEAHASGDGAPDAAPPASGATPDAADAWAPSLAAVGAGAEEPPF